MSIDERIASRPARNISWFCRGPILVTALFVCLISFYSLSRLVLASAPRNPWEATEVIEAWRSLRGMPVYELAPGAHSTHVYGAVVPWIQGEIFRWVGPNNISGRVLSLVSALLAVTVLALALRGDRSAWFLVVAWAMIMGVNHRSGDYFAENRPDMTAMMFAAAGTLLLGLGHEKRRWAWVVLGCACLVVGFFFKQTAFIFAAVPLVVPILRWRRPTRSELLLAVFPPAVAFTVVLGLRVFSPTIYHYMIVVPKAFGLDWVRTARCLWNLLIDSPLFLLLVGEWIIRDKGSLRNDSRVLWLFGVFAVTIPFSAVTAGKVGGAPNSLLPALLAMMAFCALRLPRLLEQTTNPAYSPPARLFLGAFVSLLLLMTAFPHMTRSYNPIASIPYWDKEYTRALAVARQLPGMVICPEDPTIPLYAKGYVGYNAYSENDTHLVNGVWPDRPPATVLTEIRAADYALDVSHHPEVGEDLFRELGFEPIDEIPLDPKCYRVWRRAAPNPVLSASRTLPERKTE